MDYCRKSERGDLLAEYVSGQLSPEVQADFELHILECQRCQEALETLQVARDDLATRAHDIRSYSPVTRIRLRWRVVVAATLSLILCSVGIYWYALSNRAGSTVAQKPPAHTQVPAQTAQAGGGASQDRLAPDLSISSRKHAAIQRNPEVRANSARPSPPVTPREVEPGPPKPPANKPKNDLTVTDSQNDWTEEQEIARLSEFTPPTFSGVDGTNTTSGGYLPSSTLGRGEIPLQGRVLSLFQDAMLAYDEKRYGDAEALLIATDKLKPFDLEVILYLGICKLAEGNASDAIEILKFATSMNDDLLRRRKPPSPYAPAAHFCLAKAYLQMRDLYSAEQQLKEAPEIPEAQALLTHVQRLLAQRSK
jgi:Putative zinc-finger